MAALSAFEALLPLIALGKDGAEAAQMAPMPRRKRARASGGRRTDEEHHAKLVEFVVACGGSEAMLKVRRLGSIEPDAPPMRARPPV